MQRLAKTLSWLGIVAATYFLFKTVSTAFQLGGAFMSYETFAVLFPFGLGLLALSKYSNEWLIRLALIFNGILMGVSVLVLLGEFVWHMLGPRFTTLFVFFVLAPSALNYVAISRRRRANLRAPDA